MYAIEDKVNGRKVAIRYMNVCVLKFESISRSRVTLHGLVRECICLDALYR